MTEAACAVIKLSMHSVDIYITEKHHYVVLQKMLINVYFRIFERTPFEKNTFMENGHIHIYIYTGTCGRSIALMSPSIYTV
jgi:hypothetical protein